VETTPPPAGPGVVISEPGGGRTHDPQIKSLLLYQLSYRPEEANRLRN
jgi:hypothetical protein